MKRLYFAAHYARNAEMRNYRDRLTPFGYEVTSRWIDQHGGSLTEALGESDLNADPSLGTPYAEKDIADIVAADTVISFTNGQGRGGRHVEFGIAWALQKQLIIIGPREHVFHCLPGIHCWPNFTEFYYNLVIGATG